MYTSLFGGNNLETKTCLPGREDLLNSLHHVALKIMSQLDFHNLLQDIIVNAMTALEATDGFVDLFDDELQAMVTRVGIGLYAELIGSTANFTEGISGIVWRSTSVYIWNDEDNTNCSWLVGKAKTVIGIPLKAGDKLFGVIGVGFSKGNRRLTPENLEWLDKFAEIASTSLNNAFLHTAVKKELLVRKWVEEALQTSQDRYQTLVDNIGVGIWLLNQEMEIVSINNQLSKWFPTIDISQRSTCYQALEQQGQVCNNCPVIKTFHDGSISERVATKVVDGVNKYFRIVTWPIMNKDGTVSEVIQMFQDIANWRQAEEQLMEKNLKLQEALDKLGRTQSQLIQQEKLAGIGQLAAGVAHEINNPLGFVISNFDTLVKYLDRLKEVLAAYSEWKVNMAKNADFSMQAWINKLDKLEKEKKLKLIMEDMPDLIKESTDGLDRVSKIIKELRAFSRVDNQNNYEEYDVNEGIESALIVARNEIKYWAEVEKEFADIPNIQAVGGAINQVFLNIIVNAAQAIKLKNCEGLGLIRIRTYNDDEHIYCDITDSGVGISAENLNKLFNPFFTTKPVGQGTGLGLSISYDIVNKHHGEINVSSNLGVGTTFTIKLPIKQTDFTNDI